MLTWQPATPARGDGRRTDGPACWARPLSLSRWLWRASLAAAGDAGGDDNFFVWRARRACWRARRVLPTASRTPSACFRLPWASCNCSLLRCVDFSSPSLSLYFSPLPACTTNARFSLPHHNAGLLSVAYLSKQLIKWHDGQTAPVPSIFVCLRAEAGYISLYLWL